MAQPILVTQSTSIVQVDTSLVTFGSPAVVLLSTLNAPGALVTIRDIAGLASTNRGVLVSTTQGVHFLDGPSCNIYAINQPYGFLTVTPKTSSIWAVTNTFAFPEGSTAANVNQFTANFATISSLTANQALMSTVGISTLSTDTTQVRYNLSVGQSTITDSAYVKGSLTALSSISTAGSIYAASSLTTRDALLTGHLQASCIQVQQSTGFALQVAGAAQFASTVSVLRDVYVGGNISTQGSLVVGGNFAINGGLQLTGLAITGGVSTSGTLGVARDTQLLSSLLVKDDGYFYRSVSVASNLLVGGSISTLSSLAASSISARGQAFVGTNLSVMSSLYAGGNVSVGGDLVVAGNLVFNDVLLDLNALSVFSTLTVGAMISTTGNAAIGQGFRVTGSTILQGLVSTASSLNVGGSISTTGNLAVGGAATFLSTLVVRGALTNLDNVNISGAVSTQSTVIVGDTLRVASNVFIGGVLSTVSTANFTGNLLVGGQANLSSGLSTIGAAAFFSSVQIQGSVSVMSSMVVRQDMTVQGTLNASGFSLPGAAAVASIGVQTSTGVSAVFAGSTVQTGLLSTLGGINMGGQFSTPNTITTGSTLFAQNIVTTAAISSLSNMGVAGNLNVLGTVLTSNLTVNCNTILNCNVTFNGQDGNPGSIVFNSKPYFSNGFNGAGDQDYEMGNVKAAGELGVSSNATFSNLVTAQSNITTSSLTVTGNTLINRFTSTLGQAAFFSSVAIQGNLSVFSSMNVSCNLNVGGILTAGSFQLPGGAILQTLAVTSNSGFTVNVSSSTLHAGLFSTSGAIFSGREISTTSSILVGGIGRFQAGISSLGQAAFASNVQVDGGLVSLSTVIGANISASKLQASSIGIGVANSSNAVDVLGTVAIQGPSFSNTLRLTATDTSPGLVLSNSAATYTIFNTKSGDGPEVAGALAVFDSSDRFRMVMFPNGNTSIGAKAGPAAATLDVDGLALASNMGAPRAQFSTVGAATANTSTLNVRSNIVVTNATGNYGLAINSGTNNGISVTTSGTSNALLAMASGSGNLYMATIGSAGEWLGDSAAGDSVIRVDSASKKFLVGFAGNNTTLAVQNGAVGIGTVTPTTALDVVGTVNARTSLTSPSGSVTTLSSSNVTVGTSVTVSTRNRIIYIGGTFLLYSTDGGDTYNDTGVFTGSEMVSIATNGVSAVAVDRNGSLAYAPDGIGFYLVGSFSGDSIQIIWDGKQYIIITTTPGATLKISSNGLSWSTSNPFGGQLPKAIAFNGFIYMVACANGAVFTSRDLVNWSSGLPTGLSSCTALTWTGTRWIVGGQGNSIVYSSVNNGVTWTAVSGFTSNSFANVSPTIAVSPTMVIIGNGDTQTLTDSVIGYSLDGGSTFTFITLPYVPGLPLDPLSNITGISWVGDRFILTGLAASATAAIFQSFDGINWTYVSTFMYDYQAGPIPYFATALTYSPTIRQTINGALSVDAISTTGTITSADTLRVGPSTMVVNPLYANVGINCNAPQFTLDVNGNINAAGNLYVAGQVFQGGGGIGAALVTSSIAISTVLTSSINVTNSLTANNTTRNVIFVSGTNSGSTSGQLWRSVDGTNYTQITLAGTPTRIEMVGYNGSIYAAVGRNSGGALLWSSTDSVNWNSMSWTTTMTVANTIKWNGQYWLIGGADTVNTNRQIVLTSNLTTFVNPSAGLERGEILDLAWNGTLWIAVGKDNSFSSGTTQNIRYSYDGLNWSNAVNGFNSGSQSRGTRVIWDGLKFVAVGDDATCPIKYSYDGIAWYNSANALSVFSNANNTANCFGVGWNGKSYVATGVIGTVGRIAYSSDANMWFPALTNSTFTTRGLGVGWTGNQWLATGQDSTAANTAVRTSSNGSNWTASVTTSIGTSVLLNSVTVNSNVIPDAQIGNTSFYSKQQPTFMTSTNTVQLYSNAMLLNELYTETTGRVGINCNAPQTALAVNGFVTMNKQKDPLMIVIGLDSFPTCIRTSLTGGSSWVPPPNFTALSQGLTVCWDGQRFLMSSSFGDVPYLHASSNGITWTFLNLSGTFPNTRVRKIIWTGQQYIAVGLDNTSSNASIVRSPDALRWTAATSGGFSPASSSINNAGNGYDVATNGSLIVAVGTDTGGASIKYSRDGAVWTNAIGSVFSALSLGNTFGGRGVATNGRIWVAVGSDFPRGATIKWSLDGIFWNNCLTGGFNGFIGASVAWNGQYFLAVGSDTNNSIQYSLDGMNWIGVSWPSATYQQNNAVIWTGTEWRIVGYTSTAYTASFTGAIPPAIIGMSVFTGTGAAYSLACSSNVYADLQVENLAIYGRNQFPLTQSTNNINLSSSNMTINNGIVISSNGRMGYGTTNPGAAFDVLGGGGASGLFVQTIAGSLTGVSGNSDGYTTNARLSRPHGVAVDSNQNVFFSDMNNNRIRVAFSNGVVSTLCGGSSGSADGVGSLASFNLPHGICIDPPQLNLYVCDYNNNTIRRVVIATGTVTTVAGSAGNPGFVNGTGSAARFRAPVSIISTRDNNELYIADSGNNAIRKIASGNVVTTFAGQATPGRTDATGTSAQFNNPFGLAITATTLYISDNQNNMIRFAPLSTSNVSTLTGSPTGAGTSAGTAAITEGTRTIGSVWNPEGIALSPGDSQLYIVNRGTGNGTISAYTFATNYLSVYINGGIGSTINVIDGAIGTARFNGPRQITTDQLGNIYTAEDTGAIAGVGGGNRVRKITSNYTSSIAALSFDYSGGGLSHYIRSRHMPTDGRAAENAIDFFLNTSFNTLSSISTGSGNVLAASITAAGVGIGTATPCNMLHIAQDLPFSFRSYNPLPAQMMITSASGTMKFGAYYTGGQGFVGSIQVSDSYLGREAPQSLLLQPLGGSIGIGTASPTTTLHVFTNDTVTSNANAPSPGLLIANDNNTGGTGALSPMLTFATSWNGSGGGSIPTGGITGYKTAGAGAYGGGLQFWYTSSGTANMRPAMMYDGLGRVGIGTADPLYQVTVSNAAATNFAVLSGGATTNTAAITLSNSSNNGILEMTAGVGGAGFWNTGASVGDCVIRARSNAVSKLWLSAGVSGGICISNQNVGIGTAAPSQIFQVGGTTEPGRLRIANNNSDYSIIGTNDTDGANNTRVVINGINRSFNPGGIELVGLSTGYMPFYTAATERMRITNAGRVGIGTTTPGSIFEVNSGSNNNDIRFISADNYNTTVSLCENNSLLWGSFIQYKGNSPGDGNFNIGSYSNGTTRSNVTISIDGKVGIGTTTPTYSLHVHKAGTSQDVRVMLSDDTTGTGATDGLQILKDTGQNAYLINYENAGLQLWTNNTTRMTITSAGRFGFGNGTNAASPPVYFVIGNSAGGNGSAAFFTASGSGDQFIVYANGNTAYGGSGSYFYYNSGNVYGTISDRRIKENIVDISPSEALDFIISLKPAEFDLKETSNSRQAGFIAQDILSNCKNLAQKSIINHWETYSDNDPDCPHIGVSDRGIVAYLVGAVKQLKAEFDAYKAAHP